MTQDYWESEDKSVRLFCADCLEILPTLVTGSVDAVVADPPYGMGKFNRFGSRGNLTDAMPYTPIVGDDKPFDPSPFLDYPKVILFGGNWFSDKLPAAAGWIIWDKRDGMTSNNFGDCEMAWVKDSIATRIIRHRWNGMIKDSEKDQHRVHPMQKPIAVLKWIVENYTNPDNIILDPFMGSGTTGVACVQTGRKFIGIEIEEKYFEIAKKRIQQAQLQIRMDI
jgi:site-specific DNA-methyltransferase (adenine-specific)/modification methylase